MSKPNEVTTLTPEQILNGIYSCNPFTADIDDEVGEALQQLNTYYLNLFMECRPDGRLIKSDEQERDKGFNEAIYLFEDNLKNKLGADWN